MLETKNAHPRDQRISFFEGDHRYEVDGRSFISVTTLIKNFFPAFDPDEAIRKMRRDHPLYGQSPEKIKATWEANRVKASAEGTELHRQIEVFLNTGKTGDMLEFNNFHHVYQKRRRGEPFRTEWMIFDDKRGIAGTIDYIYRVGDHYEMTDWKRSRKIKKENRWQRASPPVAHLPACNYSEYCLQQNIYRMILQENYGINIKRMSLLQMHGQLFEAHPVPMLEKEARAVMDRAAEICETV